MVTKQYTVAKNVKQSTNIYGYLFSHLWQPARHLCKPAPHFANHRSIYADLLRTFVDLRSSAVQCFLGKSTAEKFHHVFFPLYLIAPNQKQSAKRRCQPFPHLRPLSQHLRNLRSIFTDLRSIFVDLLRCAAARFFV